MYPRDAVLVGMEDLSGKGGAVAPGVSLLQQLGAWHLNLNCWVSSDCARTCVVCVCPHTHGCDHETHASIFSLKDLKKTKQT